MVPNKNAVLNLELDLIQFAKIQAFLDPSQPFFQLKLFCTNQQIFENLQAEIRKNNIKIHSLDINFPSQHKKNGVSEAKDIFLSNLEESSANFKHSKDEDEDEEEKKGVTPKSEPQEKIISKVDIIKLLYIRANNKLEEIQEDLQDDDPSLQITIDSDNIIVKGDKKTVHKAERKLRMLVNNLVFRNFDKKFNNENSLNDFLNQEFVQDILTDSGVKALQITPKCQLKSKVNDYCLVFFVEDKDRSGDLEEAIRSLLSHRSYNISLNKFLTLSTEEKSHKKKTLQTKYDYIKRFLENDLKEKAMTLRLKFQDIIMQNKEVIIKLEGEDEQMELFSNDLNLFFKNLRTITLISQVVLRKRIYYEVTLKNLEILEKNHIIPEMESKKYPVILSKKYEEDEECVYVTLVSFTGKDKMEELTNLGKQIQDTINYTERIVHLPHAVFKKFKKAEHLRSLENEFLVDLSLNYQKKEIAIIGNIEQIKLMQEHIKNEELEALREKSIFRFDNLLIFYIFCKYEFAKLPEALKNQGFILDSPIIKKESKSFEFLAHPDNKQKISLCIDEIIAQIQHNIGTKIVKYSGKATYKILSDPFFIKNLINFPNDAQNYANMIPVDIITNQQKLKNMKLVPTTTSRGGFSNLTEFNYNNLVMINLHDSNFPSEIELKGLIINIDVKGSYLDKNSEKIAESSETNRFVAKEINKLNDNNLNKKKRAEVYPIVECRNPSKNYKIMKMFYSIMKHKKLMSNPNINKEVYSMALDNTKRIFQDPQKFTYRKNLEIIFKSALDDKYETLGIMVPNDEFLDDLSAFLQEFCQNNAEFTSLKNIHIFTNDNKESTYLSNKFRPFFTLKNEINPVAPPKNNNILIKDNNMKKLRWKYLDNKIEIYFNESENQNINFAYQKKATEFLLVKKLQQNQSDNEIYLNLIENKATNLALYKPMNFDLCVRSSSYLTKLVDNYNRVGIPNVTYYEGNSIFYRLDFKTDKVEQIGFSFSSFPLMTEEGKEEEVDFFSGNNEENEKVTLFYGITGYSGDIDEAEAKIMQEVAKLKIEEEYMMPKTLEDSIAETIFNLVNDSKKGNMELSYHQKDKKIIMKGTKEDISEAISIIAHAVSEEINKFAEQIKLLEFPKEWVPQDDYFKLVKLEQTDKDYLMVKVFFDKTMNGTKIHSIKRIQNKSLFHLYWNAKQHLSKNKSMINEKYLFHGSKENNPKEIYNGKDCGFDMRLSKDGMWGKAIYFAENASYADNYAFTTTKSKRKQIIFAYVLVGETVAKSHDANSQALTRPPKKNPKTFELYDSVQGQTQGSTVFMIYDNNRAYPAFIISYI